LAQEFIIALIEHRAVGNIFVPMLIEEERSYFTVKKTVKLRDYKSGEVELNETELGEEILEKERSHLLPKYGC